MSSAILCELSCLEFFSKEFTHPRCSFIFIAAKLEFLDTRDIITDIKIKVYTRARKNAHGVERVSSIKQGRALDGYRLQNASLSLEIFFRLSRFAKTRLLSGRRDAGFETTLSLLPFHVFQSFGVKVTGSKLETYRKAH